MERRIVLMDNTLIQCREYSTVFVSSTTYYFWISHNLQAETTWLGLV